MAIWWVPTGVEAAMNTGRSVVSLLSCCGFGLGGASSCRGCPAMQGLSRKVLAALAWDLMGQLFAFFGGGDHFGIEWGLGAKF